MSDSRYIKNILAFILYILILPIVLVIRFGTLISVRFRAGSSLQNLKLHIIEIL